MNFNELTEKYNALPRTKRGLVIVMPVVAIALYALMSAPRLPNAKRAQATIATSVTADCSGSRLHMSVFGRSLVAYDWQSGDCRETIGKSRTNTQ